MQVKRETMVSWCILGHLSTQPKLLKDGDDLRPSAAPDCGVTLKELQPVLIINHVSYADYSRLPIGLQ